MQIIQATKELHGIGIVHRDLKPENILLTSEGKIKLIDYGAAVDMSTGVNFNPGAGMLDPRFAPPEELVLPENFPKAPGVQPCTPPVTPRTLGGLSVCRTSGRCSSQAPP